MEVFEDSIYQRLSELKKLKEITMEIEEKTAKTATSATQVQKENVIEEGPIATQAEIYQTFSSLRKPGWTHKYKSDAPEFKDKMAKCLDRLQQFRGTIEDQFEETEKDISYLSAKDARENPNSLECQSQALMPLSEQIAGLKDGQVFIIKSGTYTGGITLNAACTIVGEGNVIITSENRQDCMICNSTGAVFHNIEFQIVGEGPYSSAVIGEGQCTFIKCRFTGAVAPAVIARGVARVKFIECTFQNSKEGVFRAMDQSLVTCKKCNFTASRQDGVCLQDHSASRFYKCTITANHMNGVNITDHASALFQGCTVSTNNINGFVIESDSEMVMIRNNTIKDNFGGPGIFVKGSSQPNISENKIIGNKGGGLTVSGQATAQSSKNEISNTDGKFVLVSIVQQASLVSEKDIVTGTCSGAISIENNASFNANLLTVRGINGGKSQQGGFGINVSSDCILMLDNSIIDQTMMGGLKVSPGSTINISNTKFSRNPVFACYIQGEANGWIRKSVFTKNQGVGILADNANGNFTINSCEFLSNPTAGIDIKNECNMKFEDCRVGADPGFVTKFGVTINSNCGEKCKPQFIGCNFFRASEANIGLSQRCCPYFEDCTIVRSEKFGAAVLGSDASFKRCLFMFNKNHAVRGNTGAKITIKESKITANISQAINAVDAGTLITLEDSEVLDHTFSTAAIISNEAEAAFIRCTFKNNMNVKVQNKGKLTVDQCDFSYSGSGMAIEVSTQGHLYAKNTKVHDERHMGIYFYDSSSGVLEDCEIYNCTQLGVVLSIEMSHLKKTSDAEFRPPEGIEPKVTFKRNQIHHNSDGVFVAWGTVVLEEGNVITNNGKRGIIFGSDVKREIKAGNTITGNRAQGNDVVVLDQKQVWEDLGKF